ncbi:phage tail protein [uncultured Roseovarius sp.]|uniref:phage tail protein n=1 Tax=uncultured Roseovarius sp. TaxID=293344 RepID=UPI00260C5EA0|nr:phage tail protein [uncultured Roseovarius sp.]
MSYYPPVAFSFSVRVSGNRADVDQGFQEVSGLDAERISTELEEGGENRFTHKLPGHVKSKNLVLKRGIVLASSPLFKWCKDTLESDMTKPIKTQSLTVSLLDQKQKPLMTWAISNAWPVKWNIGAFNAVKNEIAVETMELAYTQSVRKVNQMQKVPNLPK